MRSGGGGGGLEMKLGYNGMVGLGIVACGCACDLYV